MSISDAIEKFGGKRRINVDPGQGNSQALFESPILWLGISILAKTLVNCPCSEQLITRLPFLYQK